MKKISNLVKENLKVKIIMILICVIIIGGIILITILLTNKIQNPGLCIVEFESNGGTLIEKAEIECGSLVSKPENPTKEGFIFKGWFFDGNEFDFLSNIDKNIIINAKWEADGSTEIVNITFNSKGGSKFEDIQLAQGSYLILSTEPTKEGYTFIGWYLNDELFDYSTPVEENINLIAKWNKITSNSDKNNSSNTSNGSNSLNNSSNINDTSNSNISSDTNNYDDIVSKYVGIWYLNGYSDVYIEVNRYEYIESKAMYIKATNFSFPSDSASDFRVEDGYVIYPCLTKNDAQKGCGWNMSTTILYNNWEKDLNKNKLTLNSSYISINGNKFVRIKGTKNKYTNSFYKETIGTWYLYNNPNSTINITTVENSDLNTIYYCIGASNFNIKTFETNSFGSYGCENALWTSLYDELEMKFSEGVLTIQNSNGTRKFYKTKTTINASSVYLNHSSLNMLVGDTDMLTATVSPKDSYDKSVSWSSSNEKVVTVLDGKVKAIGKGTAIITAVTKDGNHKASCNVTVNAIDVTGVSISRTNLELIKGNSSILTATILPNNATDSSIIWTSSNTSVATVSKGKVTAIDKGTATITVTTKDGNFKANCTVTVSNPQLTATGAIGYKTVVSDSLITSGVNVTITVKGGTGSYNYYYIKLYTLDGALIAQTSNTSSNSIFAPNYKNGSYYAEFEIKDSDGAIYNGKTGITTISK